jgi:GTP-binding protein EngB required for normal cell division
MAKLKTKLIDKINSTNDKELLKEVYRLLEMDFDDQDEVYKLSKEQKAAIREAKKQIKQGDFLTDEESNKVTEAWLKRK